MRLGISMNPAHSSPVEWAEKLTAIGVNSVILPCSGETPDKVLDQYVQVCRDYGLQIAEVGAWRNVLAADPAQRKENLNYCKRQLAMADYVGARCCVNISGTNGERWDGPYKSNYGADAMKRVVESVQEIIDSVKPQRTFYTLEPMPWMIPDSPEQYLEVMEKVDRKAFAVHMDIVNMIASPERYFFNGDFMEKAFKLLKGKIRACHLKDVLIGETLTLHLSEVSCGKGGLDLKRYMDLAMAEDPEMPLLIEHLNDWDLYLEALQTVRQLAHS